ncbi:MAG: beta-galactosidase [Candidatus Sericytochromatia bacterium]|nr:beta-galactosidase [Candidatus Tanganyikabacteria bacterium]
MSVKLGAAYYPEQVPRERWAADAAMMREAGFGVARLGEFGWAFLEPEIGRFDLDWLDEAIAVLATAGLRVVLCTPTAAPPAWLTTRLGTEVLPVGADGRTRQPGSRRHYCPTSEAYQTHALRVVAALGDRFGKHPAVVGWQIDNELGCHDTVRCYCPRCAERFRAYLRHRYEALESLNQAWGTAVWSQRYSAWEEVLPPANLVYRPNPGHWLDWCRFSSFNVERFLQLQVALLRKHTDGHWIAHNFMGRCDQLDHAALARHLDLAGYDHYAPPDTSPGDRAFELDRIRGLLGKSFWVLEQQAAQIDWGTCNPLPRPGEARLMTLQAVAHGADAVLYWPWRAPVIGAEQLHGGVLPHDGRPGRTFHELQALAAELADLPPLGHGQAPIAFLRGEADRWALDGQRLDESLGPDAYDRDLYQALWGTGLDVDVLPLEADLAGYRVVVAATRYLVGADLAARLERYVQGGGLLVLGPRSGTKTPDNQVWQEGPPGPLSALCGVRVLEFEAPGSSYPQSIGFDDGAWFAAGGWRERLEPAADAEVVARYLDDFLAGEAAIVSRLHGEGRVWYSGVLGGFDFADHFLRLVLAEAGLTPMVAPSGIERRTRQSAQGPLHFVLNHTAERKAISVDEDGVDLLTGAPCSGILELPPYGAAILAATRSASPGVLP